MKRIERIKECNGYLERYEHESSSCQCAMTFSVFLPSACEQREVPTLYWLSGLTCTDENPSTESGAQYYAARHGVALVMPDTSPRGASVPDMDEAYDLGKGAGFYVNATREPWSRHYRMYDYVTRELPELIEQELPVIPGLKSISGHSMGGHGALICGLKEEGAYRSVSAFAPICHPSVTGWGQKCFATYLGSDRDAWKAYDATELIRAGARHVPLLIDQGSADGFLYHQLYPKALIDLCEELDYPLNFRLHEGYNHSYRFISTFIGDHIAYHAGHLLH